MSRQKHPEKISHLSTKIFLIEGEMRSSKTSMDDTIELFSPKDLRFFRNQNHLNSGQRVRSLTFMTLFLLLVICLSSLTLIRFSSSMSGPDITQEEDIQQFDNSSDLIFNYFKHRSKTVESECRDDKMLSKLYSLKSETFSLKYDFCDTRSLIEDIGTQLETIGEHFKTFKANETKSNWNSSAMSDIDDKLNFWTTDLTIAEKKMYLLEDSNKDSEKNLNHITSDFEDNKRLINVEIRVKKIESELNTTRTQLNDIRIKLTQMTESAKDIETQLKRE